MIDLPAGQWQNLDRLLDEALGCAPEERIAYLRSACADAPGLYDSALRLLRAVEESERAFGDSAVTFAAPLLVDEDALEAGAHVGPYRIEEAVGRGGMGTVYRAARADGTFDKTVALKLVKRGMDTDEVLARFRRERQVLAGLDHPGIARLLDGGAAEDGRPYLAMEFVDGGPITDYVAERGLDVDARLALFERVCEAVQHAHQRLVVHRDLKPSNILVCEDEHGQAQVKLLDFGIAKLLESDPDEVVTRTGIRPLTPAYAAPEQLRGETVTTAADVYALGVVLYELLTGQRPDDPPKPPSAVAEGDDARRLRGDLDVICLTALREEPEARYGSVEALLDDLRRHRTGLPVEARPASVGYRVRKFAGRHRVGVAATALVALALVAGLSAALWQAGVAARERDQAEEVTRFVEELFTSNTPTTAPTDTITARTLLARGEARADDLDGQPAVQAHMLRVLGSAWVSLGRYDRAEPLLDRALALSRAHAGVRSPALAEALDARALLAHLTGDYERAVALNREALTIVRRHYGAESEQTAEALASLAATHSEQSDYATADALYREALAIHRRAGTSGHEAALVVLQNYANLRYREGAYDAADSLYAEALAGLRALHGPQHPEIARLLYNLVTLRSAQGDDEAALQLARETLAMRRHLLGDNHPDVFASMTNEAAILSTMGRAEEAEARYRETIRLQRERLGAHPEAALTLNNLATVLSRQGRFAEAEPLYREALAIRQEVFGERHPRVASTLSSLGSILRDQGAYDEAERFYAQALAIRREALGPDHPEVGHSLHGLARLKHLTGDLADADALYREALVLRRNAHGPRHTITADNEAALAALLTDRRAFEEAERRYRDALSIYEEALGVDNPRTQRTRDGLAALYEAWGRPGRAARVQ
ncbi:MAG: serine/threonine-protein kinase [Rubricoccaceae bacterium]|nr:serine/threonine-protein kinase [Rubricoccaceae bacterium]